MLAIKFALLVCLGVFVAGRPSEEKRLIKVSEDQDAVWMSEEEIFILIEKKTHFMDVTGRNFPAEKPIVANALPTTIRFQDFVTPILSGINIPRMEAFVDAFDDFPNRYYNNQNGVTSSDWLFVQVEEAIASSGYQGVTSVNKVLHSWPQNSVIAKIEGSDPTLKSEVLIFGAHQDTINSRNPSAGIAPGSDDNASGSVTLLESLRVLLAAGVVPKRSIEFQWYAAEEVGLRGSGDIAQAYSNQQVNVIGMVNFDVVGYRAGQNEIGLLTDYTNPTLTSFLKLVIDEYCTYRWVNDYCGYACSDHASFHAYNFPASSPSEFPLNPYMHTTTDTTDRMSFEQVAEFVKLTIAAAIEIAEPTGV
ncbi:probable leucine aminopeptidase 1 [Folsomia candida]|uniref:Putative leucine aminopeptidase 1 n=1 Tax=Folsomia candida TaxID=158441 RepID=A0A226DPM8_FOLCA|nr:probable leucine aminopeptidase 1 [Folsomia candida]OXA47472.1 putative leucine aminopeptidase 1 [Folsomia candida]